MIGLLTPYGETTSTVDDNHLTPAEMGAAHRAMTIEVETFKITGDVIAHLAKIGERRIARPLTYGEQIYMRTLARVVVGQP